MYCVCAKDINSLIFIYHSLLFLSRESNFTLSKALSVYTHTIITTNLIVHKKKKEQEELLSENKAIKM